MVEERITDGRRIAELLASEVEGRAGALAGLSVVDATPDIEPTTDGARAYDVVHRDADGNDQSEGSESGGTHVATVYVQPDRTRVEVHRTPERALSAAAQRALRGRPRASEPPAALVFVESGAQSKRAADVLGEVATDEG